MNYLSKSHLRRAQKWIGYLALLATLGLGGCATTSNVDILPSLQSDTVLAEGQGLVTLRIVNAGSIPLPINNLWLSPKNLNESETVKPILIEAIDHIDGNASIFAAPISSGEYSISNVRAFQSTYDRWYSRWVDVGVELGTFYVAPSKVTDLGTIIYYPKTEDDRYLDMVMRSPASSNLDNVKGYFENVDTIVSDVEVLTWNEDELEEERRANYVSAVQNPVVYNEKHLSKDGSLFLVGKLGALLVRTPEGDWALDAVETDSDMHAISSNDNGGLVIGGEQGALFYKASSNGEWRDISLPKRYQIRELLLSVENEVDVIASTNKEIRIFRVSNLLADVSVKELRGYRVDVGWLKDLDAYIKDVELKESTGEISVARKLDRQRAYRHIVDKVDVLDFDGNRYIDISLQKSEAYNIFNASVDSTYMVTSPDWDLTAQVPDLKEGMTTVSDAGNSFIGVKKAGFWDWDQIDNLYRFDDATSSWERIKTTLTACDIKTKGDQDVNCDRVNTGFRTFSFTNMPLFINPLEAIAVVSVKNINIWDRRKSTTDRYLVKTLDGGKSWKIIKGHSFPKEHCVNLIDALDDQLLMSCYGTSSDFYESTDEGKTWEHVREHEVF